MALLAGVIVAMFTLGTAVGASREQISAITGGALPAIAGILLIVAAGGGFKQVLVDSGVGNVVADWAKGSQPLAAGARLAGRRRHPAGHRLGDGRHHHRRRHRRRAGAAR